MLTEEELEKEQQVRSLLADHPVSRCCIGEFCGICSRDGVLPRPAATHKVGEEELPDIILHRHNLTQYLCCECMKTIFGRCHFDSDRTFGG